MLFVVKSLTKISGLLVIVFASVIHALPALSDEISNLQLRSLSPPKRPTPSPSKLGFYPVHCLSPIPKPPPIAPADCEDLIENAFIKEPHPSPDYRWGYGPDAEKHLPEAGVWHSGQCVVVVANEHLDEIGLFNLLEIGLTAKRITQHCVAGRKDMPYGGTSAIGLVSQNFYVYVGGKEKFTLLPAWLNQTSKLPPPSSSSYKSIFTSPSRNNVQTSTDKIKRALGIHKAQGVSP
ncbi:MAG: hypothetical protein Q9163_003271 [Psora crenata]